MRQVWIVALLVAAMLTAGFGDLLSLHALYTAQDNVVDPAIEGKWENKDDVLIIERFSRLASDFYEVKLQSKKDPSESKKYEMRLVNIGGVRFADLLSADIIGHMILRVRVSGDRLAFAFFDSEWLRERIPHEKVDLVNNRKQAVLTAKTPELRTLVAKYASEPKAYDEEVTFRRTKP
jgi:hypothetical protein